MRTLIPRLQNNWVLKWCAKTLAPDRAGSGLHECNWEERRFHGCVGFLSVSTIWVYRFFPCIFSPFFSCCSYGTNLWHETVIKDAAVVFGRRAPWLVVSFIGGFCFGGFATVAIDEKSVDATRPWLRRTVGTSRVLCRVFRFLFHRRTWFLELFRNAIQFGIRFFSCRETDFFSKLCHVYRTAPSFHRVYWSWSNQSYFDCIQIDRCPIMIRNLLGFVE